MRSDGDQLLPNAGEQFEGGAGRFLFKGTNGRWKEHLTAGDLALYAERANAKLSVACVRWLEAGRSATGEPRLA